MEPNYRELSDIDLNAVSGGSHLGADEVKALVAGQILIVEDCMFDLDVAKGKYTGVWRDPGTLSMLEVQVEILEVYEEFRSHGKVVQKGDVVFISRWCLDFPERA